MPCLNEAETLEIYIVKAFDYDKRWSGIGEQFPTLGLPMAVSNRRTVEAHGWFHAPQKVTVGPLIS
jgi:hypothetical protein